jgi:hypothetical protein
VGGPQGTILGPVLFNVFLNDIFGFVTHSTLYNYADDNTVSHAHHDVTVLKTSLETDSKSLINWFHLNKMKANPDKFQAIAIGKKANSLNLTFDLGGTVLECEKEAKLLDVTIDFMLYFNIHITNMCRKAARQLNILKRTGYHLDRLSRMTIYYSFIVSNFSYYPLTWHFCSEANTAKIEKLQERAPRFIYSDNYSSYEKLLKYYIRVVQFFLQDLMNIKNHSYNFRYTNTADIPNVRTTRYGLRSLRYSAPKIWNSLLNSGILQI